MKKTEVIVLSASVALAALVAWRVGWPARFQDPETICILGAAMVPISLEAALSKDADLWHRSIFWLGLIAAGGLAGLAIVAPGYIQSAM